MYKLLLIVIVLFQASDIYQFSLPALNGGSLIHYKNFKGKKILIVNTSSNSQFTKQYARLEELYQRYKDSLVVIACPSNDFSHEPGSESEVKGFIEGNYAIHFPVMGKTSVTGAGQSALYKWLTTGSQNGAMSSTVVNDFQKYLVGTDGHVIGYFAGAMDPMDESILKLIENR